MINSSSESASPTETTSLLPREAHGINRSQIIVLISTLYLGVVLSALDTTLVTTLLAHIASDLNALDTISWVATSYTIAYSAFQPLYGKFSDLWGRKRVSMYCTFIFGVGCLICGLSKDVFLLVSGRFLSGVGAGGVLSMSTVTISDYVPLRSRGIFQGLGNVAFGSGASLGGLLGGWLTSLGGWRFAFLSQVPLALICFLAQYWLVHDKPKDPNGRYFTLASIDWVGILSLVTALLLAMFGITTGGSQFMWSSFPVIFSFLVSFVLFCVFFYWETCVAGDPVMPIRILLHRTVISACLTNFFGSAVAYSFLYYTPLLLQSVNGYTYTEVGHRIVVNFVGVACGSLGSGIIMRRTGKYHFLGIMCGILVCMSSFLFLISPLFTYNVVGSAWYQSLAYAFNGLGYSGMLTVTLLALIAAVEPCYQATTTAAQYTFRGAGSSLGIAIAASAFQNVLKRNLIKSIGTDTSLKRRVIETVQKSLEAIWDQPVEYQPMIIEAYRVAGMSVQYICFTFGILGLVTCACMREHSLERRPVYLPASAASELIESNRSNQDM